MSVQNTLETVLGIARTIQVIVILTVIAIALVCAFMFLSIQDVEHSIRSDITSSRGAQAEQTVLLFNTMQSLPKKVAEEIRDGVKIQNEQNVHVAPQRDIRETLARELLMKEGRL